MTAKIARYVQEHEATLAELKIARDRLIRAAHSRGGVSYGELAREYGITRQRAHQIVHGASRERAREVVLAGVAAVEGGQ